MFLQSFKAVINSKYEQARYVEEKTKNKTKITKQNQKKGQETSSTTKRYFQCSELSLFFFGLGSVMENHEALRVAIPGKFLV